MTDSAQCFDSEVYAQRLEKARSLVQDNGLSGMIIGTGPELAYLTGSWVSTHERLTALVVPAEGEAIIVVPDVDRGDLQLSAIPDLPITVRGWFDGVNAHEIAASAITGEGPVALGSSLTTAHVLALQELLAPRPTVLATRLLAGLFACKDDAEIEQLQGAADAIDRVHAAVPGLLQPGRTEAEVAADIERLILEEHSAVDFIIVGSDEHGANPHHSFSERVLTEGSPVVVDIGGTYGVGYHSDCTRTYIVGGEAAIEKAPEEFRSYYAILEKAQEAAFQAVRPGVKASEIDGIARGMIADAGYGEAFFHRTGHGIGLSTHEEPNISADNDLVLQPGMCFSIEPGIYVTGKHGARIEDIVMVTEDGAHRFNTQPRSLR
ncbi:Xaa-Pro peptidase family protein [Corynebacterium uropygiale]|uniref:Xaa-Pro peptidase family protein n=1 Tax=Corynebacterium uropygiale TaxID=1775911 RepID=A0A9X1QTC2_9CORY|nr:Xaa-Pro peptidase family protein [Corynebacterium uropygiale]MCF4006660.1 Xaa-Pro peptidase family protein [Corynebacterium uropygiale]